jgi:protein ImuA
MAPTFPPASAVAAPAVLIDRLRRKLCAAEVGAPFALGIPMVDAILGGGLGGSVLHEIAAAHETETAAATAFALALATRRNDSASAGKGVLWIAEDLSLAENAAPYGPGLDAAGIAPERLITVAAARGRDVLWAMEEALRCRAVGVVIGEMRPRSIGQVASRRLSLAAAAGDTLGLILRTAPDDEPSSAATRWIIAAHGASHSPSKTGVDALVDARERAFPSEGGGQRGQFISARAAPPPFPAQEGERRSVGPPRLAARLVRNRRGHLGAWIVEWDNVEQRFELATHFEPVAGAAFDRPHRAAVA